MGDPEDDRAAAFRAAARYWLLRESRAMPDLEAVCADLGLPDLVRLVAFLRRGKAEKSSNSYYGLATLARTMREEGGFAPAEIEALTRRLSAAAKEVFDLQGLDPVEAFVRGVEEQSLEDFSSDGDDYAALFGEWVLASEGMEAVLRRELPDPADRSVARELAQRRGYLPMPPGVNPYAIRGGADGVRMLFLGVPFPRRDGSADTMPMTACVGGVGPAIAVERRPAGGAVPGAAERDADIRAQGREVLRFAEQDMLSRPEACAAEVDDRLSRLREADDRR